MGGQPAAPVFLDVEASGIAGGSFPIEVGIACPDLGPDGRVDIVLRSYLVRPAERWRQAAGAWTPLPSRCTG